MDALPVDDHTIVSINTIVVACAYLKAVTSPGQRL